jgi:hypothetical protein
LLQLQECFFIFRIILSNHFNSERLTFQSTFDAIWIERPNLKGHVQFLYLNLSNQIVKEGLVKNNLFNRLYEKVR